MHQWARIVIVRHCALSATRRTVGLWEQSTARHLCLHVLTTIYDCCARCAPVTHARYAKRWGGGEVHGQPLLTTLAITVRVEGDLKRVGQHGRNTASQPEATIA